MISGNKFQVDDEIVEYPKDYFEILTTENFLVIKIAH